MSIDYEQFRQKPWDERVTLFNEISAEEKAELVRTHVSHWLDAHRAQLTSAQIAVLEECIAVPAAELYAAIRDERLFARAKEVERRAAALLSREQMREALTMHWD